MLAGPVSPCQTCADARRGQHPTNNMQRITIRIPDTLFAALEARAAAEHRDLSNMVRRILSLELDVADTEELDTAANPELGGLTA